MFRGRLFALDRVRDDCLKWNAGAENGVSEDGQFMNDRAEYEHPPLSRSPRRSERRAGLDRNEMRRLLHEKRLTDTRITRLQRRGRP